MKIVHLVAGAGSMYCGSCLHGNTLAAALRAAGGDVVLAPLYTPLRTDDENVSGPRIAFGGLNVYLQQRYGVFRHTPWMFDRMLDHPSLLRWATRRGGATRPEGLGELTLSMLRGEEGRQGKELEKLLHWLEREIRPERRPFVQRDACRLGAAAPPTACRTRRRHALRRRHFLGQAAVALQGGLPARSFAAGPPTWTPWWP